MNDFTKEELKKLIYFVKCWYPLGNEDNTCQNVIIEKLDKIIGNYCEHKHLQIESGQVNDLHVCYDCGYLYLEKDNLNHDYIKYIKNKKD